MKIGKDTWHALKCLNINAIKNTEAISKYLNENFDKDKNGCLSPEEIQDALGMMKEKLPTLKTPEERSQAAYVISLLIYSETVTLELKQGNQKRMLERLKASIPAYANYEGPWGEQVGTSLIVLSFICAKNHSRLVDALEKNVAGEVEDWTFDKLAPDSIEPLQAILQEVLGCTDLAGIVMNVVMGLL